MAVLHVVTGVVASKGDAKRDNLKEYLNVQAYDDSDFTVSVLSVPKSADISVGDSVTIRCKVRAISTSKGPRVCYFFDCLITEPFTL